MSTSNPSSQSDRRGQFRRASDRALDDQLKTFSTSYCHACLERMADGVLLLDNDTQVIFATPQIDQIMERQQLPLSLSPKFNLHHQHHALRFSAFVNERNPVLEPLSILLDIENGETQLLLNCFRFPHTTEPQTNVARYMITLCDPYHYPIQNWLHFLKQFNLTPAEGRLCRTLADGLTLKDYCTKWKVAASTGRSQLHSIFGKTATHRQTELLRLIYLFSRK